MNARLSPYLEDRILPEPNTGCWLWAGPASTFGYGVDAHYEGGIQQCRAAHRAVYEAMNGPIGEGLQLHHRCGQKLCVNPTHLETIAPGEHAARHNVDKEQNLYGVGLDAFAASIDRTPESVRAALETITVREEYVLNERYGLSGGCPRTMVDIAATLGISSKMAFAVRRSAIHKLTLRAEKTPGKPKISG